MTVSTAILPCLPYPTITSGVGDTHSGTSCRWWLHNRRIALEVDQVSVWKVAVVGLLSICACSKHNRLGFKATLEVAVKSGHVLGYAVLLHEAGAPTKGTPCPMSTIWIGCACSTASYVCYAVPALQIVASKIAKFSLLTFCLRIL
jgi:hypothetical protein